MLSILDRYLLKEAFWNWLAVTLVLWAIVLSNRLARYLAEASAGDIPGSVIFTLLGLKSVNYLTTLIPLTLFLGVLLALGRLYKDSEMIAMQACGIAPRDIYRPLLWLAGVVAGVLLLLSLYVAPRTAALSYDIRAGAEQKSELSVVAPGQFEEGQEGRLIFYAEQVDAGQQQMAGIFVRSKKGETPVLMTAQQAEPWTDPDTGDRFLVLEKGYRYQGQPGDESFRIAQFERHGLRVEVARPETVDYKADAVPTLELLRGDSPYLQAELQWRISLPVAAVMLVILAVPLSRSTPRQGRYSRLFVAVLIFVIYYNLMGTAQVWMERGVLPAFPGLWWTHVIPLVMAWLFAWRSRLKKPRAELS